MSNAKTVQLRLAELADPEVARHSRRYFQAGPGQYGEGDVFHGIRVPQVRDVAREFQQLPLAEVIKLLHMPIHEVRLSALHILVLQAARGTPEVRRDIYNAYLEHRAYVNNWDLVDSSAPQLVGSWLLDKSRRPLFALARAESLWDRRIAIVATLAFIRANEFGETLAISEKLLHDTEPLLHKAVGWMLREVGKRDVDALVGFLRKHHADMPRTMLRYAIERFEPAVREQWRTGNFDGAPA